jgi:hypothetical protein
MADKIPEQGLLASNPNLVFTFFFLFFFHISMAQTSDMHRGTDGATKVEDFATY